AVSKVMAGVKLRETSVGGGGIIKGKGLGMLSSTPRPTIFAAEAEGAASITILGSMPAASKARSIIVRTGKRWGRAINFSSRSAATSRVEGAAKGASPGRTTWD